MKPSNLDATGTEKHEVAVRELKDLTRRTLWKLDVHVLPPLALVSLAVVSINPLTQIPAVMARKLHRPHECRKRKVTLLLVFGVLLHSVELPAVQNRGPDKRSASERDAVQHGPCRYIHAMNH